MRISPDGKDAEMFVAGMNLVGLAFSPTGDLAVASTDSVYQLGSVRLRDAQSIEFLTLKLGFGQLTVGHGSLN